MKSSTDNLTKVFFNYHFTSGLGMKYAAFTLAMVLTFISFDWALGVDRKHKMRIFPRIEVPVD